MPTTPPCGINCAACPNFTRPRNPCPGSQAHCPTRRCGIYRCCVEKKGLTYCWECKTFPCSKLRRFAQTWRGLGQDLIANLERERDAEDI